MIPAWFVAHNTCVIIGHILSMCVTHIPIIVVFDFTLLIGGRLVLLSGGVIPCAHGISMFAAGGAPYALQCCNPPPRLRFSLPFPHPRPHLHCWLFWYNGWPSCWYVCCCGTVVVLQYTMVQPVLNMPCGEVPFRTLDGLVGTVGLVFMVKGVSEPVSCRCSWLALASFAQQGFADPPCCA